MVRGRERAVQGCAKRFCSQDLSCQFEDSDSLKNCRPIARLCLWFLRLVESSRRKFGEMKTEQVRVESQSLNERQVGRGSVVDHPPRPSPHAHLGMEVSNLSAFPLFCKDSPSGT